MGWFRQSRSRSGRPGVSNRANQRRRPSISDIIGSRAAGLTARYTDGLELYRARLSAAVSGGAPDGSEVVRLERAPGAIAGNGRRGQ